MKISFVIPCYGSEKSIEKVVKEIKDKIKEKNYDYEIILINDHSYDNVWEVINKLALKDSKIKGLSLSKNMNKPGAVMAGLSIVSGDYVVLLDDDGQCPMSDFYKLLEPIIKGHDVVYAKYPVKKQSKFKNFGSFVNKKMAEILIDKPKSLYFNNFSIMKKYVVDEMIKYDKPYPYIEGLVLRITHDIVNVTMEERSRETGKTNFTIKKMLKMWVNGFTSFSVKPLRMSTYIGFICALIGFIYGASIIIERIFNSITMAGYSSIMAAILFIGGLILMMLGLIGEYVGRIYICINNAPQYVIKESINVKKI